MGVDGRTVVRANVDIDAKHRAFGFGRVKGGAGFGSLAVLDEGQQ